MDLIKKNLLKSKFLYLLPIFSIFLIGCNNMGLLLADVEPATANFTINSVLNSSQADIVMSIDTSGSMEEEINAIKNFLGSDFIQILDNAGIDYHFVLIAGCFWNNCTEYPLDYIIPDDLTNDPNHEDYNPNFLHVARYVGSELNYRRTIDYWDDYKHFLRTDSNLNLIVITDDNDQWTDDDFQDEMNAINRPNYMLHGIVGIDEDDATDGLIDEVGENYIDGINATNGNLFNLTTNGSEWDQLLKKIADDIIEQSRKTFILDKDAVSRDISVFKNEELVSSQNWSFSNGGNSITLFGIDLDVDDIIRIEYLAVVNE